MTEPSHAAAGAALEDMTEAMRELRARFEAEIEPHRRTLWHYCLRLTGSPWDAEDLVQDTLQRALARLADLWQPVNTRAYLFRIATNLWIDRQRREVRAELRELTEELRGDDGAPDLRLGAHEALAHLVAVLTPLQRVVFLLCDTLDFTGREAAEALGTTEGAVKAALHRARRALADEPPGTRGRPAAELEADEVGEVVRRYIEAFDARDPDAIAALLHEDAITTIVGTAEEIGREASRGASLAEWAAEPVDQWVRAGRLAGREALFVFARGEDGAESLYSLIELDVVGPAVVRQRVYFYSPELLEHAAGSLGVPAMTHGHRYQAGEA